jgi:Ca2+-transporting ATPase
MAGSWKPRGGESQPVEKTGITLEDPELALGDRTNMLFMNTDVSRGRAVMVVTGTGMDTQIGNLATVLQGAGDEKTPLQKRIDQLARLLTGVALAVVTVVFLQGLVRGLAWCLLLKTAL